MFSNLSLKFKLIGAFLSIALFMGIVAGISKMSLQNVHKEYDFVGKVVIHNLKATGNLGDNLRDVQRLILKSLVVTDPVEVKKLHAAWLADIQVRENLAKK